MLQELHCCIASMGKNRYNKRVSKKGAINTKQNDFSQGSVWKNILSLALPMTIAQTINVLYNVVDRIYIGHLPQNATLALTGLGLTFPILSIVTAFANFVGMGGAPLCSIARGGGDDERAERIMGNSFTLLLLFGVVLTAICLIFKRPLLYLFGASDATFPYADSYLTIYLCGSLFVMIGLGMNSFINSQGFGKIGMMTVMLGAVTNIILDPIFIFVLGMGVRGAALATILSQMLSAVWVIRFLLSKKAIYRIRLSTMRLKGRLVGQILGLGSSGFIMALTNSTVQIVCNAVLRTWGGDLYVGVMTVLNSLRELVMLPATGIGSGTQPVLGYNYGAGEYPRVRKGIIFSASVCTAGTALIWILLMVFPTQFFGIFSKDAELIAAGVPAMHIYFFGVFLMAAQMSGQNVFIGLGKSKYAIFFSIFRKVIIVAPLTVLLPYWVGTNGVFLAEPISNLIGGVACFGTMLMVILPMLRREQAQKLEREKGEQA